MVALELLELLELLVTLDLEDVVLAKPQEQVKKNRVNAKKYFMK